MASPYRGARPAPLTRPHPELLAFVSWFAYRPGMDTPAAAALAEYGRAHPEAVICLVEGTWHAWLPSEDSEAEAHGRDEAELLAKLPS